MDRKEVKIIGLSINKQFGFLQACKLQFDNDNRLITVKGAVGQGKTTLQKGLQLATQGSKALTDKKLYGEIDVETQLLDGDVNIWVGCRSNEKGKLIYTLYTKDEDGNIIKEPVIDGVKATPSKYLDTLQTELTWKMDELTSENPTVQKKILLKLYQHKLREIGVIFDKKSSLYKGSILEQIEQAENKRTYFDAVRKQHGGIAEDLKERGYDIYRPDTLPHRIDSKELDDKIRKLEQQVAVQKATIRQEQENKIQKLKTEAAELLNRAIGYNSKLEQEYTQLKNFMQKKADKWGRENEKRIEAITTAKTCQEQLAGIGFRSAELGSFIDNLPQPEMNPPTSILKEPLYIKISKDGKIETTKETENLDIIKETIRLRNQYNTVISQEIKTDNSDLLKEIEILKIQFENSAENNKICDAVDSFLDWQSANEKVLELKSKYVKLLSQVNTGVRGLIIKPESEGGDDLFLMYDGSYDPSYFNNPKKELRKLSSYSGTQKPVICLLIQNYLLNEKPKSMRYMYIDNIPMDNKTVELLKDMCTELDLRVFLNITGDFEQANLKGGEFLIEGGEVFFNKK